MTIERRLLFGPLVRAPAIRPSSVGRQRTRPGWRLPLHNGHPALQLVRSSQGALLDDACACTSVYNLSGIVLLTLLIPTTFSPSPFDMEQTSAPSPFVPLFDTLPSSRSSAASIWAPQPQPSENTWSKAIDSFSRSNFGGGPPLHADPRRSAPLRSSSFPAQGNGEDIFGPLGFEMHCRRDVGAIGDGRKRLSPTFDELAST